MISTITAEDLIGRYTRLLDTPNFIVVVGTNSASAKIIMKIGSYIGLSIRLII